MSSDTKGIIGAISFTKSKRTLRVVSSAFFLSSKSELLNLSLDLLIYHVDKSSIKSANGLVALSISYLFNDSVTVFVSSFNLDKIHISRGLDDFTELELFA